jgi:hypothetical protein
MPTQIHELVLAFVLCQPCGCIEDRCWWGMRTVVVFNRYGFGIKVSVWGNGESHLAFGRHGVIVGQAKVLPAFR